MPSTYTLNNGIELIGTGEQSGTWGDTTNTNLELLDTALDGQVTITAVSAGSSGSPNDLPISDGAASNGRNRMIIITSGTDLGADVYFQLTPNDAEKIVYVRNDLNTQDLILFQGTYNASNDYVVPNGTTAVIFFDGAGSGAVAANVFNNAYFDSLRLGSVSVTAILDEDNMSSDSATALATQQSIKAYVDTQVGANNELSEILANGNTTGGTDISVSSGDDITFADSSKAIFGAGSDLQIYHDGSNSYVRDVGTGVFLIQGDSDIWLQNSAGTASYARFTNGGASTIYYDNAAKLSTTSTGIDVTGTAVTDGLTVAGNLSVDGGTIKLDGNYPTGTQNVALGDAALDSLTTGGRNVAIGWNSLTSVTTANYNVAVGGNALALNTASNNTALGDYALTANTTGDRNTAVGQAALVSNTTGASNDAFGSLTLDANTTGSFNVAVGRSALSANTTASNNTAVGHAAAASNTTGTANVAVGYLALNSQTTNSNSTAVGAYTLRYNTGNYNSGFGNSALTANTSGTNNVAVGMQSLASNTTASNNTAVGYQTAYNNTGGAITAIGQQALYSNTGSSNVAVGYQAAYSNTSGQDNVALGRNALRSNTTVDNQVAVGYQSLYSNTTGTPNVALGAYAAYSSTTGGSLVSIGYQTMYNNTTGSDNTAVGRQALFSNTTASNNTAVGYQAGYSNTTGGQNTVVGQGALFDNTTGIDNTAVGRQALANATSSYNTAVGIYAGINTTTGSYNQFFGRAAGQNITTGSKNTILGSYNGNQDSLDIRTGDEYVVLSNGDGEVNLFINSIGVTSFGSTRSTSGSVNTTTARAYMAGRGAKYLWITAEEGSANAYFQRSTASGGSNFVYFAYDTTQVGTISTNGSSTSYNTASDYRLKENVVELTGATTRLKQLEPKRFNFIADADTTVDGFLAHEVSSVVPEAVTGTHNEVDDDGNPVYQGIDQAKLVPLLVATIKELEARITALENA